MNSTLFDIEHLQELTYERSKSWATFLESLTQIEDSEEFEIEEIDQIIDPKSVEANDDELASMEDEDDNVSLDSEVLRTINNTTRFSLMFNNNATVALPESTRNEEYNLLDLLNQTLPIINEHNRQLKEYGFERILSTFDKQKIEDKVGSWLNRHNSLYGGDNTLLAGNLSQMSKKEKEDELSKATRRMQGRNCKNLSSSSKDISHDSDDSLQSGETARYIRSSRAGAMKNSATTTTMIKTYRMVKSTREALREKYACEKLEDEYHLKSLRHRRRFANELEYHHNHYDLARQQRSRKTEKVQQMCVASAHKERRKVLRKRNYNNSCSTMDTSSDSDSYYYDEDGRHHRQHLKPCCNQYHCSRSHGSYILKTPSTSVANRRSQRSAIKMPSARMNRMYYYSQSQTKILSTSSSSNSFSSSCESRRMGRRNLKCYNDNRPCKRESECQCCNERKLCDEYKHVVNSSTEEWYVENCYSPKRLLKTPASLPKSSIKAIPYETEKLPVVTERPSVDSKMKRNLKTNTEKNNTNNEDKIKINSKRSTKAKTKTISSTADQQDDTFQFELQKAIEESKKLYEKEQQQQLKQKTSEKAKIKHDILPSKPLRKTDKQQDKKEEKNKTNRKRQTTKQAISTDLAITLENEEILEKLPKLTKNEDKNINENKSTAPTVTEETFFANNHTQAICNSTALSGKNQAYNRQINDKFPHQLDETEGNDVTKQEIELKSKQTKTIRSNPSISLRTSETSSTTNKSQINTKKAAANSTTAVTSTTIRSPELHSSLSNTTTNTATLNTHKTPTKEVTLYNDDSGDCTLVTSTTNIEISPTRQSHMSAQNVEEMQQQQSINTTNSSNISHDPTKGIIIYAPGNRSTAPAHSFTNDGYFTITKEHLSSIIGEKAAEKFLKYYIGRKRFNSNSTVYFRPPTAKSSDSNNISASSDSDDDLESLGQYGDLYESLNKTS